MPLRYLLDENLRGILWSAIQRHNARGLETIDVVRVGDPPDLPLATPDPAVLVWAEREERILVSFDKSTLPTHLASHLAGGHHCPGIFVLGRQCKPREVLEFLVLAAHASEAHEWRDWIKYL